MEDKVIIVEGIDPEKLAEIIEELEDVEKATVRDVDLVFAKERALKGLALDMMEFLYKKEDSRDLDCDFRAMRDKIVEVLGVSIDDKMTKNGHLSDATKIDVMWEGF